MVEFLRKSESRGNKIGRVNLILITKSINLHYFSRCWSPLWYREIFREQSIYREVYTYSFDSSSTPWGLNYFILINHTAQIKNIFQ